MPALPNPRRNRPRAWRPRRAAAAQVHEFDGAKRVQPRPEELEVPAGAAAEFDDAGARADRQGLNQLLAPPKQLLAEVIVVLRLRTVEAGQRIGVRRPARQSTQQRRAGSWPSAADPADGSRRQSRRSARPSGRDIRDVEAGIGVNAVGPRAARGPDPGGSGWHRSAGGGWIPADVHGAQILGIGVGPAQNHPRGRRRADRGSHSTPPPAPAADTDSSSPCDRAARRC